MTGAGFRWRIFPTIKGPAALVALAAAEDAALVALVAPAVLAADVDVVPVALVAPAVLVVPVGVGDAMAAIPVTSRARTCTRT